MNLKKLNEVLSKFLKEDYKKLDNGWYYSKDEGGWYYEQAETKTWLYPDLRLSKQKDGYLFEIIDEDGVVKKISGIKEQVMDKVNTILETQNCEDILLTNDMFEYLDNPIEIEKPKQITKEKTKEKTIDKSKIDMKKGIPDGWYFVPEEFGYQYDNAYFADKNRYGNLRFFQDQHGWNIEGHAFILKVLYEDRDDYVVEVGIGQSRASIVIDNCNEFLEQENCNVRLNQSMVTNLQEYFGVD